MQVLWLAVAAVRGQGFFWPKDAIACGSKGSVIHPGVVIYVQAGGHDQSRKAVSCSVIDNRNLAGGTILIERRAEGSSRNIQPISCLHARLWSPPIRKGKV